MGAIRFKASWYSVGCILAFFSLAIFPIVSGDPYHIYVMTMFFMWAVVAISWNLLIGYSGVLSFGQLVFFAVGGYTSSWLALNLGVSPWIGMIVGGSFAAITAVIMGLPTLRLKGIYVALFTLAFQEMMRTLALQDIAFPITHCSEGLTDVPPFEILGMSLNSFTRIPYYYLAFIIFITTFLATYKMIKSHIGLGFIALRDSETYAACVGISAYKYKTLAFMISAFFTGVMGSFYAHYFGVCSTDTLSFAMLVNILIMIVVGGMGTIPGPVFGAFVMTFLSEYLRFLELYRLLIIGLLIVLVMILIPSGLMQSFQIFRKLLKPKM